MTIESQKAQTKADGLEDQVREAKRAKNEGEDKLALKKRTYDSTCSQATLRLKRAEEELVNLRSELELARQ